MEKHIMFNGKEKVVRVGDVFGRYKILDFVKLEKLNAICECECEVVKTVLLRSLLTGNTKSCGCFNSDLVIKRNKKHGRLQNGRTRLYGIWQDMKRRCSSKSRADSKNYHQKGIRVCESWADDFPSFEDSAIKNGYNDHLTIERIDNNKGYNPENCKWIPKEEQSKNRASNHFITYEKRTQTLSDWAKELNIKRTTLSSRIVTRGWEIEKAFSTKIKSK